MTSPEISGGVMYKKTARAVGNEEGEDLRIFVTSTSNSRYRRKLHYVNRDHWSSPLSESFTWEELINGSSGVEAISDKWTLKKKN